MEENEDGHVDNDSVDDDNKSFKSFTTDFISSEIREGSENYGLLKAATVDMFVKEGKRLILLINDMPLNLEDMPDNFRSVRKLLRVYNNARDNMDDIFCTKYFDNIMNEGLFSCLAMALQNLQNKWPDLFSETSDPNEEFRIPGLSLTLEQFPRPEMAVASVWVVLNAIVLDTTGIHEGCRIKAAEEGVLEYMLMECIPALSKGSYHREKTVRGKLLLRAVTSVYNCSVSAANFSYFERFNGVEKLLKLNGTTCEELNMTVLFALAYLIDEESNHLIVSTTDTIDKIIECLTVVNYTPDRMYCGWNNIEIADALNRIAVNDDNKKMIGKRGGLLALVKMFIGAQSGDERIASAKALWMLLFDTDNQAIFKGIDNAFVTIIQHKNSENEALSKAISGIIWELKDKYKRQEKADLRSERQHFKHVMLSYNWGYQKEMLKIRDALKDSGYKIWMDVDQLGGSTLEGMASAVENSAVILVAVSRKYKESANCRSEAEYAFQRKSSIIPLMMEKNYQPDGWLGFVVGSKLWIEFTDEEEFRDSMIKLIREIGERGKIGIEMIVPIDVVDHGICSHATPMASTKQVEDDERIECWSNGKVVDWLAANNRLDKKIHKRILESLTGKHLVALYKLHHETPEFFYNSIRADFGFRHILDQLDFTDALQELIDSN